MNNAPYNPTTGAAYADKNGERLREACARHGWTSYQFAGFHQWRAIGRVVRKGEHGTKIALVVPKRVAGESPEAADQAVKVAKMKAVFNLEQTDEATQ